MPFCFFRFSDTEETDGSPVALFAARFMGAYRTENGVSFMPHGWKAPLAVVPASDVFFSLVSSAIDQDRMGQGCLCLPLPSSQEVGALWRPTFLPFMKSEGPAKNFKMIVGCRGECYSALFNGTENGVRPVPFSIEQIELALKLTANRVISIASQGWKGLS